jgi:hypothetical protein
MDAGAQDGNLALAPRPVRDGSILVRLTDRERHTKASADAVEGEAAVSLRTGHHAQYRVLAIADVAKFDLLALAMGYVAGAAVARCGSD